MVSHDVDSIVISKTTMMIKTINYLSYGKDDLAINTQIYGKTKTFFLRFKKTDDGEPSITLTTIPIDIKREDKKTGDEKHIDVIGELLTFYNFDGPSPVYNKEPLDIGTIEEHRLLLRAKIQTPYPDAGFRDITLSFFLKKQSR